MTANPKIGEYQLSQASNNHNIDRAIVFTFDDKYCDFAKPAISMVLDNIDVGSYEFFVLHQKDNLSDENIRRLKKIFINLQFIEIDNKFIDEIELFHHFTKTTLARLFIGSVLPKYINRAIYLDVDITIMKNINQILNAQFLEVIAASPNKPYENEEMNTGFLIINLKKWRELEIEKKIKKIISDKAIIHEFADQNIINMIFDQNYFKLSVVYNFQQSFEMDEKIQKLVFDGSNVAKYSKEDIYIYHFSGNQKPWNSVLNSGIALEAHNIWMEYNDKFSKKRMEHAKVNIIDLIRYIIKNKFNSKFLKIVFKFRYPKLFI